ncbi:MAG: alpha/beta hydrolase [Saprospiraceae bacterium]|nr:alpha/beta hydrolase [Saprospiraceae bacterium]MCF8251123.1 alpha/beta hydrolase [Saprospiraceae bacterium]MCF8282965.1 alpha/beta hydrolase [Bacteroidales bacterium]MCF8312919.1 alpha/beta hydrolase [Saprospiraceae bacterium]MCF8441382.1 alpha/beta hydrolase [Saprospiraceae bacterium]
MKQLIFVALILSLFSCKKEDPTTPGLLVPLTVAEDPTLPSIEVNGTRLHSETFGSPADPMVVLIHGGPGGDYRSLLKAKDLVADGFYVVFYDQRGTGLSERVDRSQFEGKEAVQLMIDDLDAIIQYYQMQDTQKVFLFGHSWGAMLATAYINQHPGQISGAVLAEPGGFTWPQVTDYLSRSNKIHLFEEELNDAIFPDQIFSGRGEHEVLDYKAAYFAAIENAPGNNIGNAGPYPFWRNGAVAFDALFNVGEKYGIDFTANLSGFQPKVLFMYSELNKAYGKSWAEKVSAPFPNPQLEIVKNTGHEMLWFGWDDMYPKALTYLNELK